MTIKLSRAAENMQGSEIVKLGNAIRERIRLGDKIYNFTIGDFDSKVFPLPGALEEAIIQAYREGFTTYPLAEGEVDLRESVAAFYAAKSGIRYALNEIQIASGGRPLIYAAFHTLVDPGDKVVYAVPSWNNNHYTNIHGGEHCVIEATEETDFMPTAESIGPHLKDAALLCLCTPQNPTGTTLSDPELQKICNLIIEENQRRGADEKKLYLLFDQMYWTLNFETAQKGNPVSLVPEMKEYTLFVDGASKAFAATGIRVGWGAGPAPVIAKMKAILTHMGAWAPMPEQKGVARFLKNTDAVDSYLDEFRKKILYRLDALFAGFESMRKAGLPVKCIAPQAAIYLTIQMDLRGKTKANGEKLGTQEAVTNYLLEEAGLAIVPFYAFGNNPDSNWYRLSVGTCREEDIEPMLAKLESALEKLK